MIPQIKEYEMKLVSSLVKVFPDEEPKYEPETLILTALKGDTVSFQVAYKGTFFMREMLSLSINSPIQDHIRARSVELVPVGRACNAATDDNYLKTTTGLYPDLLKDVVNSEVMVCTNQWRSLWIDVEVTPDLAAGTYPIQVQLKKENHIVCSATMPITIFDIALPKQEIMHTEWFHADCLADYYQVEVFSKQHWTFIENYLKEYVSRGCNMILTPMFTPPLDTAFGGERTTVQLVDICVIDGAYHFHFDKLHRWVELCKSCGIEYFEMSHLFSQWGAKYAPKIMATVDGKQEMIFGWHTPAIGEYTSFLEQYIPQLIQKLEEWNIQDVTYFHLSDEPQESDLESYRAAKESVSHLLKGFQTFDALSSYEFYKHGLVDKPIPGNNEIHEFLEHGLMNMWVYYCTGQCVDVSNRFMSMPSARNRIYGVQLYKYNIIGILHWGYNFYNSQFSTDHINPYEITDANGAFPSGDPFIVYPGKDGHPVESIRMMVHYEALTDLRAFKLLESLTSKDYVMTLIEEDLVEPLTFIQYPKSDMYLIQLRNKVNREIAKRMS
ncbi:DUF4091 domain-containing protein [Lachnospiraceae bacterium LCP25S3_G4]